jgi:septum formation protein
MDAIWTGSAPLLLASTSPTRRKLLESAGLPVDTQAPGIDERAIDPRNLDPLSLARHLADEKALAVSRRHPERLVLGADQVLACDAEVFHKPGDREAARAQLRRLSGRSHVLRSAGALARGGAVIDTFDASALLAMRPLSDDAIDTYLAAAGPDALQSVGVYQLENLGIHLFEKVEGDHSTILGLPLLPLLAALRRLGCLAF